MTAWPGSLRGRLLAVICLMGLAVLSVVGMWMTGSATRAGEAALRSHVQRTVNEAAVDVGNRWTGFRSALMDVAESDAVRQTLAGEGVRSTDLDGLREPLTSGSIHDLQGRLVGRLAVPGGPGPWGEPATGPSIPIEVPVHASPLGAKVGSVRAELPVWALIPDATPAPGGVATVLAAFDPETGASLIPLPFTQGGAPGGTFTWGGDRWLVARRELVEPSLSLVGAAPLTPFAGPIREAMRQGTWLLLAVVLAGFGATAVLTSRQSRSLRRLAEAVEGVADGDLERRIDEEEAEEVSRVARAFNRMTAGLRATLGELAEHRALAAVGEFAASLAHEIRNPLTAMAVDLEVVADELPLESAGHRPLSRALREVRRLDRTVAGTLLAARSGGSAGVTVELSGPLQRAVEAARLSQRSSTATIRLDESAPDGALSVPGDADVLEQLFLNLVLNAIQASPDRGQVRVVARREGDHAVVDVLDRGPGLPSTMLERAFEPLVSGREGGTGLGLTICRRIARALGGTVRLENRPGGGAVATVELPLEEP